MHGCHALPRCIGKNVARATIPPPAPIEELALAPPWVGFLALRSCPGLSLRNGHSPGAEIVVGLPAVPADLGSQSRVEHDSSSLSFPQGPLGRPVQSPPPEYRLLFPRPLLHERRDTFSPRKATCTVICVQIPPARCGHSGRGWGSRLPPGLGGSLCLLLTHTGRQGVPGTQLMQACPRKTTSRCPPPTPRTAGFSARAGDGCFMSLLAFGLFLPEVDMATSYEEIPAERAVPGLPFFFFFFSSEAAD